MRPLTTPLLIPDLAALSRKLANPPPLLGRLYARFREQLTHDGEFRRDHVFLPALLGDSVAMAEAKGHILTLAFNPWILAREQSPSSQATAPESLEAHIWCVTPRAMRVAVYFTWLDVQGVWTDDERRRLGTALLDFVDHYVVPVLRARIPGGHNQQLSMTFCSAVVGHAFASVEGVAERAQALRDWAMPKFRQTLGLMPASGYSGEGSAYQSGVVSALVMWAGIFLDQCGEPDVWHGRREPNGGCLADSLRLEAAMGSCGGLLPPWDHYGWSRLRSLAARTLWARISGNHTLLSVADSVWDEKAFIAWRPDDRLWTLIYWPEREDVQRVTGGGLQVDGEPPSLLTGWSLPAVGGAIEHAEKRLRVMLAWDRSSESLQAVGRAQVNPNHLIIDFGGEPITGDGIDDGSVRLMSDTALARTLEALSAPERELIAQRYGSPEQWACSQQSGFIGQSCAILVDGWESYFPHQAREGRLVFERRAVVRHTFAGEACAYYQPAFDVTRMRRTVSMGVAGVAWVVDDIRAASAHDFTWRIRLRRGVRQVAPRGVRLDLASGRALSFAWLVEADGVEQAAAAALAATPTFPAKRAGLCWPDNGSERCDLTVTGSRVRFVTCLVPEGVDGLIVRQDGPGAWEASWSGGSDRFTLPREIEEIPDESPVAGGQIAEQSSLCDLDEAPFGLLDNESDAALLAALEEPPVAEWRRTGAAMQTLVARGNGAALPRIRALLLDPAQNYTVHSVAAWCLGRAGHLPALDALRRMAHSPEDNTAARAQWAVERTEKLQNPTENGNRG